MSGGFLAFVRHHIVSEVPTEMEACLDCDASQCTEERYRGCHNRLERFEALRMADAADRDQAG